MLKNKEWIDVRMFYTKTDMAKYISHLDTVRCLTRAMKRANVPIWFTQGFNPRAFLTFAMPLSLGFESYCEVVDFRITEEMDLSELQKKLDNELPPHISVKKITLPNMSFDDIKYADYKITFNEPDKLLMDNAENILKSDEILVEKKSKKGRQKVMKLVNIKEHIKKYELSTENGKLILNVLLSAGTTVNINPTLLIKAMCKDTNTDSDDGDVIKIQSYNENMEVFN